MGMTPEERARYVELLELVDAAKPVVELWNPLWSQAQKEWKVNWLTKAQKALSKEKLCAL
jgi:hypothetical protein